ncbi:hypothetical protein [Pumilibacter intestinalis]|uniref:hypothetical protein n=1 Tax=Pumilibacter intestinalis TaxID=2941511 RepID=UPI00203FE425|nr:hypothetical protein [Pumilibacter intestinalis]
MEQKQLTQFTFYDLYWDLIKQSDDSAAGRLIRNICKYMFTDEPITEPQDDKENYFWSNIVDVLDEDKQCELSGRIPKTLNRKMRHFTFLDTYYKAVKLITEAESGQYVKTICDYIFDGTERKLKPPVDAYFALAKRKLSLARTRKKVGAIGGKSEKPTPAVTLGKIKSDFHLSGELYNKDEYLRGIDLAKVYAFFKANLPMEGRNIYRAFEDYKRANSV